MTKSWFLPYFFQSLAFASLNQILQSVARFVMFLCHVTRLGSGSKSKGIHWPADAPLTGRLHRQGTRISHGADGLLPEALPVV